MFGQLLHCVALCCLCIYLSGMAIFTQRGEKVATIGVHSGVRVRLAGGAAGSDGAAGAFTVEWGEESCREALEFRRVARAGFPQRPAPTRTQLGIAASGRGWCLAVRLVTALCSAAGTSSSGWSRASSSTGCTPASASGR